MKDIFLQVGCNFAMLPGTALGSLRAARHAAKRKAADSLRKLSPGSLTGMVPSIDSAFLTIGGYLIRISTGPNAQLRGRLC